MSIPGVRFNKFGAKSFFDTWKTKLSNKEKAIGEKKTCVKTRYAV